MEEFRFTNHHHTHEQQNTMKQDLATIHHQLGLIQAWDVFLSQALENYYQALSISIEACGGEFPEVVAQSHYCLACMYECFAEHAISSKEVMRIVGFLDWVAI
jgi:CHAD domain-containing protein